MTGCSGRFLLHILRGKSFKGDDLRAIVKKFPVNVIAVENLQRFKESLWVIHHLMSVGSYVALAITFKNKDGFCNGQTICGRVLQGLELLHGLNIQSLNSLFGFFHS
jgi:hypothetical protein